MQTVGLSWQHSEQVAGLVGGRDRRGAGPRHVRVGRRRSADPLAPGAGALANTADVASAMLEEPEPSTVPR